MNNCKKRLVFGGKGFTLLEVVVAVGLLGLITASVLPLFLVGHQGIYSAGNKTQALNIAKEKMEYLLNRDFEALLIKEKEQPDGFSEKTGLDPCFTPVAGYAGFASCYKLEEAALEITGYVVIGHQITVKVLYEDHEKKISLFSFLRQQ